MSQYILNPESGRPLKTVWTKIQSVIKKEYFKRQDDCGRCDNIQYQREQRID